MLNNRNLYIFLFMSLVSGPLAYGQQACVGISNSSSGFGLTAQFGAAGGEELNIFSLGTDNYGIFTGRTKEVGFRISYSHNYIVRRFAAGDFELLMHVGAGAMTGYVHDFEAGIFGNGPTSLKREMGVTAALACTFGACFDFRRGISVEIGYALYPGIHIRTDRETGSAYVSVYKNGLMRLPIPSLNIMYRF